MDEVIDHRFFAISKAKKNFFDGNLSIFTLFTTSIISLNIFFLGLRDSSLIQLKPAYFPKMADFFCLA